MYINNLSNIFLKKEVYKKIILLLFIFAFNTFFGQNKGGFDLLFSSTEAFYFNAVIYQDDVIFGSDIGAISFKNKTPFIVDKKVKGPIKMLNGSIEKGVIRHNNFYNYLLPSSYRGLKTTHVFLNSFLYIICKGDLFAFKASSYKLKPYPSIRSISKNYIGTYEGIFLNDSLKLNFPSFTLGHIREHDSVTILNWGGISIIKDGHQEDYFAKNINDGGIEINDLLLGEAIDSYEIKHPYYILSTSKGLYKINSQTRETILLQKAIEGPYRFIRNERDANGLSILYLQTYTLHYREKSTYLYTPRKMCKLKTIFYFQNQSKNHQYKLAFSLFVDGAMIEKD